MDNEGLETVGPVLLVEDDDAHAIIIQRAIRRFGDGFRRATNREEADRVLADMVPGIGIVLTDLNLPDSSASETVAWLIRIASLWDVVILTSSTRLEDAINGLKAGARDFLVKDYGDGFNSVIEATLRRVARVRSLETDRAVLAGAIDYGTDGMAILNQDEEVLYANAALKGFCGEVGGSYDDLDRWFGDSPAPGFRDALGLIRNRIVDLADGGVWQREIVSPGVDKAFLLSISIIPGVGVKRFVVRLVDVTERVLQERRQRMIFSSITHDLKGPLSGILLSAELLLSEAIDDSTRRELLTQIGASARNMAQLIEEFLGLSQLEAGALVLRRGEHSIVPLIQDVLGDFSAPAKVKGISLVAEFHISNTTTWDVDRLALTRVVGNLVSNALKFSPMGSTVRVSVDLLEDSLRIAVKDQGRGMSSMEIESVFVRYKRLEQHHQTPGTGIGLHVCSEIVRAHGGVIEVTSMPGEGSVFTILLPRDILSAKDPLA
jgi:signal transduction histidine kinase